MQTCNSCCGMSREYKFECGCWPDINIADNKKLDCSGRMAVLTRVTILLTLFSSLIVVFTQCGAKNVWHCDDPLEILKSIKADTDNYQQLLNAFYPINWAKPSSVIIAYFTNYTDPLPEECSLGIYPWRTYPGINYKYHNIYWYMWTTTPIHCVGTNYIFMEFGEYLPAMSFYLQFNKSSPFNSPSQIACIKTHLIPDGEPTLGDVTTQVVLHTFTYIHV